MQPYACPNCRNKMRFHVLDQNPVSVKLNPQTGEVLGHLDASDVMAQPYRGEVRRVQCAICGMNESESLFVKTAQRFS
ncbi:MAG TPA: DNA alkylation repair protein [Bacilli bacterium]|nr:DNA alkylation repair protein [Bacilli bacterium]